VLSGAFGGYSGISGPDAYGESESDNIFAWTQQRAAIYACDYARGWDYTNAGNEAELINYDCNASLIRHWQLGGLVQISNHLPNPVFEGNKIVDADNVVKGGLKKAINNTQYSRILTANTDERKRWLAILDKVAAGLKNLRDNGVIVIYRPLHEMNGSWFWWGATGYNTNDMVRMANYKALYKDMYNYFTYTKGLNNLIWVYSPDQSVEYKTNYYPGASYVDIVGLDSYIDNPEDMTGYAEMIGLNKPFALAEVGPYTINGLYDYTKLLDAIRTKFPKVTYFIPWNAGWSPAKNTYFSPWGAYNNSWTINKGEIWNGTQLTTSVMPLLYSFDTTSEGWAATSNAISGVWPVT
ncbi:MAG: beta-mannosidase, partial [Sphingobacteriaceae bacterium]